MNAPTRWIVAIVLAGAGTIAFVLAQDGPAAGPPPERRSGFTQFTRPRASQDVIARGQALYDTNCASCHSADLRGTVDGKNPNLLRSGMALRDQKGELIAAAVLKHNPAINLIEADTVAIAEYIHSVHAAMGGQGSPPGRNPTNVALNVLVGDPKAGEARFGALCASCHSVTGDLQGIAAKFTDARALQNAWVAGSPWWRWRRQRWWCRSWPSCGCYHARRLEIGRDVGAAGRFPDRVDAARPNS